MPFQWGNLLRILEALSFWHASTHWFVKSLTIFLPSSKFGSLVRRKAFLLCKNPCGAGCDGGRGPHRRGGSPRAKKFPEEICCAPSRVLQICRTPDYRVLKSTQYAQLVQPSVPGSPGARGAAPLCFRRSPEETLPKGFLWAISSRRLDPALLCAAKKRGVESPGWQVSASLNWRLPPRTAKTKSTLGRHCQNYRFSPRRASINSGVVPQQPPMRLAPASTSRSICCANSPDSME